MYSSSDILNTFLDQSRKNNKYDKRNKLTFSDRHSESVHPDDLLSSTPTIVPLNL